MLKNIILISDIGYTLPSHFRTAHHHKSVGLWTCHWRMSPSYGNNYTESEQTHKIGIRTTHHQSC